MAEPAREDGMIEVAGRHGLHLTPSSARMDESGADFRVLMIGAEAPLQLAQHLIDTTAAEMADSDGGSDRPGAGREGSGG